MYVVGDPPPERQIEPRCLQSEEAIRSHLPAPGVLGPVAAVSVGEPPGRVQNCAA